MIKNNEDAIKHCAEVLHRHYTGEIQDDHAKVQLFGLAVYNKLMKHRKELAQFTGKTMEEIEAEGSKKEGKMFLKKVN